MPIPAFAHALRAFHSGRISQDELSWEIDRQLAIEKTTPGALLETLRLEVVAGSLPNDVHAAILHRIAEWPRDPTVVTGNPKPAILRAPGVGVGDILQGRFSLVALIGEGGMSRVFKATDLRRVEAGAADPFLAVKVLTEPLDEYFGSIVALQREALKLQSLNHANIVRVMDCDRDQRAVFMTMEYLSGQSLQAKLRSAPGPLDAAAAVAIITAVGDALDYAHGNGIVHGDLKPGNVIITDGGSIKVIDFGVARCIGRTPVSDLNTPLPPKAVTLRYASPELAAGHDPVPADDVYALAGMAYEMLSGNQPFGQTNLRDRDPKAVLPRPAGMRSRHYTALTKALAFRRGERTPSIRAFLDEFMGVRQSSRRWLLASAVAAVAIIGYLVSPLMPKLRATALTPSIAAGSVVQDCPLCPVARVLPAGHFAQGSDAATASRFERPRHEVTLARAFAMSTDEITVGQFGAFAAATQREMTGCTVYDGHWQYQDGAGWRLPGFPQDATHPVTCVSWDDAVAYARWLTSNTGHVYRLPSAAEWEYAARSGSDAAQPWAQADATACSQANVADRSAAQRYPGWTVFPCDDRFVATAPVGSFQANAFGLHDLLGNVFEWVSDCWHDDYSGAPTDGSARTDGACDEHELRGGSWFTAPKYVTAGYRDRFETNYRSSAVGFRLVRELPHE